VIKSDHTKEYLDLQTRQSLANMQSGEIPSQSFVRAEQLGYSLAKGNSLGVSMV